MENLSFQYPAWYIILCLGLGLLVAGVLYYREQSFKNQPTWVKAIMGILRFLAVSLIAILLLSPLLKSLLTETKKPVVVIAQDQSESVAASMDEAGRTAYEQRFQELSNTLGEQYELKKYAFGSKVREGIDFSFEDKVSNVSDLLQSLYDLYSNQNLGAVVLATDGIYNEGSNPIYAGTKLNVPIYTVALGDTTPRKDLILKRVFYNKIAYLDDRFSIQVDISAQNCGGNTSNLFVYKIENGQQKKLQQFPVGIKGKDFFSTQEVILDADQTGVQRYRISLGKVTDEITTVNNTKDIFVDVLDARQKILLLANSPHPDLTAMKQTILTNKNYQADIANINSFNGNLADYDLVVLHQLPSVTNNASSVLGTLKNKKIPHLFVLGSQSDFVAFSNTQELINVRADGKNTNDVQAKPAPNFALFTVDDRVKNELPNFAPVLSPFGEFKESPNAQILLYQRIGKVDTEYPLLLFGEENDTKIGVLAAEGVWKWRLFDYLQNKNHDLFNEFMGKSLQYLSLKEDKRKFRVSIPKNVFNENESITFDAELYNESYELVNDPDVNLSIIDEENKEYTFLFNKTNNAYTLDAKSFPVGNYRYTATTIYNGTASKFNGQFSVQPVQLEVYETTADHNLLRLLSEKYGGEMVYPGNLTSIAGKIQDKGTVKPIIYQTTKTRSVINLKWIFLFLIGLLTLEWLMRRYYGGY